MELLIMRRKESFNFKADTHKPDSFENNWKNNSQDNLLLCDDKQDVLFSCNCQSVANYCFGENDTADTVRYGDTIAPGYFTLKCFVEPRKFHGEIHGIINTIDLDGQVINHESMQTTANGFQNGRWLLHDKFSFKIGKDTNYAWSAGCIILTSRDLQEFNETLKLLGVKPGDEIKGTIVEI